MTSRDHSIQADLRGALARLEFVGEAWSSAIVHIRQAETGKTHSDQARAIERAQDDLDELDFQRLNVIAELDSALDRALGREPGKSWAAGQALEILKRGYQRPRGRGKSMADRQAEFEAEQLEQTAPEHRAALEELYKRRNPSYLVLGPRPFVERTSRKLEAAGARRRNPDAGAWLIMLKTPGRGAAEVIDHFDSKAEAEKMLIEYRLVYAPHKTRPGTRVYIKAPRRSSRPKRNPARLVMPERLVLLGELRELVVTREGGAEQIFRFDDGGTGLFSDASGRELYGISLGDQPVSVVSGVPSSMKKAGDLFGKWSARKARKAMKFNLPDNAAQLERIGHAVSLVYRSDKWGQKPTMYEHVFTGSAEVHTDRVREPRVFGIHGPGRKRLVTARGIVG